jgi:hypothetical protein
MVPPRLSAIFPEVACFKDFNNLILIIFEHWCIESLPHKLTHKLYTPINLRGPWKWPRAVADTVGATVNNNKHIVQQ